MAALSHLTRNTPILSHSLSFLPSLTLFSPLPFSKKLSTIDHKKTRPIVEGRTIGGLTFAIQYHNKTKQGIEVCGDLPSQDVYFPIPLSAMKIFREFGVESQIVSSGTKIQKLVQRNGASNQKSYSILDFNQIGSQYADLPSISISSKSLIHILQAHAKKIGVNIRPNKFMSKIKYGPNGTSCTFRGGKFAQTSHSHVILTRGEDSPLFEYFGPRTKKMDLDPHKLRIEEYRFTVPIPPEDYSDDGLIRTWGNGVYLEWFPIDKNRFSVSIVRPSRFAGVLNSGHITTRDELMTSCARIIHGEAAKAILDEVTDQTKIQIFYPDDNPPTQWSKDSVIKIGPACYSIFPGSHHHPLGLETEDGYDLANKLVQNDDLASFEKQRTERIEGLAKDAKKKMKITMKERRFSYIFSEMARTFRFGSALEKKRLHKIISSGP